MSKDDLARIDGQLDGGKAAVCILAAPDEAEAVSAKLAEMGGKPESYEVADEVVEEAEAVAEETPIEVEETEVTPEKTPEAPVEEPKA
jgi:hypothetical protein